MAATESNTDNIFSSIFGPDPSEAEMSDPNEEQPMHDAHEEEPEFHGTNDSEEESQSKDEGDQENDTEEDSQYKDEGDQEDAGLDNPEVGRIYASRDEFREAYHAFAKRSGFAISTRNSRPDYLMLICDRGRKNDNAKKFTKRMNCEAKCMAKLRKDGRWIVKTLESKHNHKLDRDYSRFLARNRSLSNSDKKQLEEVDMSGVPVCINIRMLQSKVGGRSNLEASERDIRNYIDSRRRLRLGDGDAAAIHKLFMRLTKKDPRFFYAMDIADDCTLRNVMWIHPRSRAAYEDFHDVVTFDTTYLVNRYQMPFATVVGINQHHQSILLGCALLTHERSESFTWFFTNWLDAMGDVAPTAILTDQCDSIKNAIKEVMPQAVHRYCIWHILEKLPEKWKGIKDYGKTAAAFKSIIYDSLSIGEFEQRWGDFIDEYGMSENDWLKNLYDLRDQWVPIYLNHLFWAGMLSTQRSESMHAFFDGYVNSKSTLKTFVEQYEIALTTKTHREMEADYKSKVMHMTRRTQHPWEDQFGRAYTNKVFSLLQAEIDKGLNCFLTPTGSTIADIVNGIERYEVLDIALVDNWFHNECQYIVEYRTNGDYVSCQCRKFECKGIFCAHILKVLIFKRVTSVNERYILRRWRKDVYRPHSKILFSGGYAHITKEYQLFREYEKMFEKCNEIAFNQPARMKVLGNRLKALIKELSAIQISVDEKAYCDNESASKTADDIIILDPHQSKPRGRPKGSRSKGVSEKIRAKAKKKQSSLKPKKSTKKKTAVKPAKAPRGKKKTIGTQESVAN